MAEYIDREVLMRKLSLILGACYDEEKESAMSVVLRTEHAVMGCPIVDVVPVVRGRWNVVEGLRLNNAICSNCGRHFQSYYEAYRFCPNCGAKMDLDGDK